MVTKKTPAKKVVAKKAVAKKAPAKHEPVKHAPKAEAEVATKPMAGKTEGHAKPASGKYIFATGRRKTAIANVRMFAGSGENVVNKKALNAYFTDKPQQETAVRPLALTGLMGEYYFTAHVAGGGRSSQVEAIRHGVAQTLAKLSDEMQSVLKKNGFLTRDDRKKERKKPGLRGARRSPQWAKR